MLQIIKSQITYMIYSFLSTVTITFGLFAYAYVRDFNPLNLLCFILFVQYVSLVLLNDAKEKRELTYRLLTLTEKQIALLRIILVYIGFFFIYLFGFALNFLFPGTSFDFRGSLHELFMFGGIALSGIFLYLVIADHFSIFKVKSQFIWFNIITSSIIGIISFAVIIAISNSYNQASYSTLFILILYLTSTFLTVTSYYSHKTKKSYLGYR